MIEKKLLWAYMKEFIYAGIRRILEKECMYEANNSQTWDRVGACVREYVSQLVTLGYLHEIKVICDDTVNTKETVEDREFHLEFAWKVNEDEEWTLASFDIMPDSGIVVSEEGEGEL